MGIRYITKMFFEGRDKNRTDKISTSPSQKKDCCVLCGKPTDYDSSVPISSRNFYISGCGQLCEKCFIKMDFSN